jgi:hypothetical protein
MRGNEGSASKGRTYLRFPAGRLHAEDQDAPRLAGGTPFGSAQPAYYVCLLGTGRSSGEHTALMD